MRKPVILCVDDERIILTSLKEQLRRRFQNEYAVETVESGEEAMEIVSELVEAIVDLPVVISDHIMPGLKGDELLREIHNLSPRTLKILLTGQADATAVGNAVNYAQLYRYIAKPWEETDLALTVTEAVRSYFQDKKLEEQNTTLQQMNDNLEALNVAYGRFVPHEFLNLLSKQSILEVRLGEQVQQDMTILFADIRGFTSFSEQMTPEDNFRFINRFLGEMCPIIRQHNGIIDKFLGDGIMALFPHTPDDAVKAAIGMLHTLEDYNRARQEQGKYPIRIGIGINTGCAMLGIIGEQHRMENTVISDCVNVASRLEGLTKTFEASLLVSEETLNRLNDSTLYYSRFLGKVQVKGKQEAVVVFEIYNGDPEEIIVLKRNTTASFEEGLQCYFAKEFTDAAVLFKTVLKEHPGDKAAQLYFEQSAQFMVHGVPEGCQGIQMIEGK